MEIIFHAMRCRANFILVWVLIVIKQCPSCFSFVYLFLSYINAAVPNVFGIRDWIHGRQFFRWLGLGGRFQDDSRALRSLCTLLLLLLYQLHLRSSAIRSQRLGTPLLTDIHSLMASFIQCGLLEVSVGYVLILLAWILIVAALEHISISSNIYQPQMHLLFNFKYIFSLFS